MAQRFDSYGASKRPSSAGEKREWGFYWRGQLTRKQTNLGKLRYAWSLHPKVLLPKTLPYPRLLLGDMQPKLLNLFLSDQ